MSKKIWRGTDSGCVEGNRHVHEYAVHDDNCTVVPDAARFPVREAMTVCRASVGWNASDKHSQYRLAEAVEKYLRAVERMKRRNK